MGHPRAERGFVGQCPSKVGLNRKGAGRARQAKQFAINIAQATLALLDGNHACAKAQTVKLTAEGRFHAAGLAGRVWRPIQATALILLTLQARAKGQADAIVQGPQAGDAGGGAFKQGGVIGKAQEARGWRGSWG